MMIDALLVQAVQQLSSGVTAFAISFIDATDKWESFLESTFVTFVHGEAPNPTDSGFIFARKARRVLGIEQSKIVDPGTALNILSIDHNARILFVDDFIGSGRQIINTWHQLHKLEDGTVSSFALIPKARDNILYTPLIATQYGVTKAKRRCPGLSIFPTHTLSEEYSLTSASSMLWPTSLREGAPQFLLEASKRAGIVNAPDVRWDGFHGLALPIAFSHGVPDATLPLYWWDSDEWNPLISRS